MCVCVPFIRRSLPFFGKSFLFWCCPYFGIFHFYVVSLLLYFVVLDKIAENIANGEKQKEEENAKAAEELKAKSEQELAVKSSDLSEGQIYMYLCILFYLAILLCSLCIHRGT